MLFFSPINCSYFEGLFAVSAKRLSAQSKGEVSFWSAAAKAEGCYFFGCGGSAKTFFFF